MKRKYKIFIIIIISIIFTFIIYKSLYTSKINILSIGDGISSGQTPYNIDGISYNDYLKEYYSTKNLLNNYNCNYSYKNNTISTFIKELDSNNIDITSNMHIKQIINKATIITINIGEEELTKKSSTDGLTLEDIDEYISEYHYLLNEIHKNTDAKVIVISFYENEYLGKQDVILLNSKLANIVKKYNYIFINVSDLLKNVDYFLTSSSMYFSYKAHHIIAEMIINSI